MRWLVVVAMVVVGIAFARPGHAQDCNANGVPDADDVFPIAFAGTTVPLGFPAPGAIAAGDLGGGPATDLAVAHPFDDRVSLLLNDDGGGFTVDDVLTVGDRPEFVTIGRVELGPVLVGDGADILVVNRDDDTVSRFVAGFGGGYAEAASSPIAVGNGPVAVLLNDLQADDDTDLITLNRDGSTLTLVLTDMGAFQPGITDVTIADPAAGTFAAVDGDGTLELLVAGGTAGAVRLIYEAPLPAPADVAMVPGAGSLVAADLDGDAVTDLAVVSGGDPGVRLFPGGGDGTFAPMGGMVLTGVPTTLVGTDLDGDGLRDLAVTRQGANVVTVLHNRGGFVFASHDVATGNGPTGLAVLDADGDGRPDLAVTNALDGTVSILRQLAGGTSRDCDATGVPDECERATLDCDANAVEDACELRPGPRFDAASFSVAGPTYEVFAAGDLDGDGRADAVAADNTTLQRFAGAADATLTAQGALTLASSPRALRIVDLEPDGDGDVVLAFTGGDLAVLRGDGASFAPIVPIAVGHDVFRILDADLDGDGDPELIVGTNQPGVTVLRNLGAVFDLPVDAALPGLPTALTALDLEPDGDLDVVAAVLLGGASQLVVLRNAGGTLTAEASVAPLPGWEIRIGLGAPGGALAAFELSFATGDMRVVRYAPMGADLVPVASRQLAAPIPPVPGTLGSPGSLAGLVLLASNTVDGGDFDGDGVDDLATVANGRVAVFRGPLDAAVAVPHGEPVGGTLVLNVAAADVDGDGLDDLTGIGRDRRVFSARARRVRTDCAAAGQPDECAPDYTDCNANGVADACEPAAVDADGDGVADCIEAGPACGNCRDDDGDGALDRADESCSSAPLVVRSVKAKARKRGGGRVKLAVDLPVALAGLDAAPPHLTVEAGGTVLYCATPGLQRRGRAWRPTTRSDVLRTLLVSVRAKKNVTKLRAVLEGTVPAGAEVRVSVGTAAGAWTGTGVPRARRLRAR